MSLLGTIRHWFFYYPLGLLILCGAAVVLFACNPLLFPFVVAYILYVIFMGDPTFAELQAWSAIRHATRWPTPDLTSAFPVVGAGNLPPLTRPCLYTFHPHGLINASRAIHTIDHRSSLYVHLMNAYHAVHSGFFHIPFLREVMLYGGCIPATYRYMDWAVEQGSSVTLTPGGAREVQYAQEGTNREVWLLRNRKGFVRFAKRHGLPIVPLYSAGEQELFTYSNGWFGQSMRWLSGAVRGITGLTVDFNILQAFSPRNLWQWAAAQDTERALTTTYVCSPIETSADVASAEVTEGTGETGETERAETESTRRTGRERQEPPSVETLQEQLLQKLQEARRLAASQSDRSHTFRSLSLQGATGKAKSFPVGSSFRRLSIH